MKWLLLSDSEIRRLRELHVIIDDNIIIIIVV